MEEPNNYCIWKHCMFNIIFPPSVAKQMLWGQFISYETTGRSNMTADLHIEQINRAF